MEHNFEKDGSLSPQEKYYNKDVLNFTYPTDFSGSKEVSNVKDYYYNATDDKVDEYNNEEIVEFLPDKKKISKDTPKKVITTVQRVVLVVMSLCFNVLMCLIVVGFTSLKQAMLLLGYKEETLNLMFTITISSINLTIMIVGPLIDSFVGPKISGCVGSVFSVVGYLIFGYKEFQFLQYLGYVLMGIGGIIVFASFLHVINIVPKRWRAVYATLLMSSQDTGQVVFLIFYYFVKYKWLSLQWCFRIWCVIPVVHFICCFFFQPLKTYKREKVQPKEEKEEIGENEEKPAVKKGNFFKDLLNALITFKIWVVIIWYSIGLTTTYFYIQTLHEQLLWISKNDSKHATQVETFFAYMMLFIGVLGAFVAGFVMKYFHVMGGIINYIILQVICTTLSNVPSIYAQYATVCLFVWNRNIIYCVRYYFVSVYFSNINATVVGLCAFFASLVNLTNFGWTNLAKKSTHKYLFWNLGFGITMIVLSAIFLVLNFFWWWKWKKTDGKEEFSGEEKSPLLRDDIIDDKFIDDASSINFQGEEDYNKEVVNL